MSLAARDNATHSYFHFYNDLSDVEEVEII